MAVWSEVELNTLDRGRFDAEYYQPLYIKERNALRALETVELGHIAFVTDGQHGYHIVDEESEIKHITARCIANNIVTIDKAEGLGLETHLKNPRSALETGDVLIQTAGTIGNAGVVTNEVLPANIDQDVARVHIYDQETFSPWFVSVFINCELGRLQTKFESTGQVQQHLSLGAVRKLFIPVLQESQRNEIASLAIEANNQRIKSKTLYQEAEALLLHELGLDTLDLSDEITYERNFNDVAFAGRLDAQHFQPKYYRVLDAIKAIKPLQIVNLDSLLEEITNGQTPLHHNLSVGNVRFLTAEHIYDFLINYDSDKRVETEHHEKQLKKTQVKENDVLITIKGRIGNVAVVQDVPFPTNINQDVGLLRLKENIHPYYIAGFLNSQAGKALTEQVCTGQINPFLGLGNLRTVKIPIFEMAKMNELGEIIKAKVNEATETRQSAKQLLEDAKRRVEDMILGA
jgi:restriction endonuclease S subunit